MMIFLLGNINEVVSSRLIFEYSTPTGWEFSFPQLWLGEGMAAPLFLCQPLERGVSGLRTTAPSMSHPEYCGTPIPFKAPPPNKLEPHTNDNLLYIQIQVVQRQNKWILSTHAPCSGYAYNWLLTDDRRVVLRYRITHLR